jgi:hypothetical protein
MGKCWSHTGWLVAILLLTLSAVLLARKGPDRITIEDVRWEDRQASCVVSFTVKNNTENERSVRVEIVAQRIGESRVGTVISLVGSKNVVVILPPHVPQHLSYALPLATAYSGSLVVQCTWAM